MQFLDEAKIYIKSGNGGNGCLSFRRERNIPLGGPNGGNGGRGGDVIAEVIPSLNTLIDFRYQQHFKAKNGRPGEGSDRHGANGEDIIIKLPAGTEIYAEDNETLLYDLTTVGDRVTIATGGNGGFGNAHFKSSTNRAPRRTNPGIPGEEKTIWLRMKLLSDAGLVGLPNAGKSTFLAATTRAKPKIAGYPFTTLKPQLGVVYVDEKEFVLADIPGLIEGAHQGVGLGIQFLKHVERCGVLLHLIDATSEDVVASYQTIRQELEAYSPLLAEKSEIVALNKSDLLSEEEIAEKKRALAQLCDKPVHTLSAATQSGTKDILRLLYNEIDTYRKHQEDVAETG